MGIQRHVGITDKTIRPLEIRRDFQIFAWSHKSQYLVGLTKIYFLGRSDRVSYIKFFLVYQDKIKRAALVFNQHVMIIVYNNATFVF